MSHTRVLFIANTYPHWTGTDSAALTLIGRMAARGYDVTVVQTWTNFLEGQLSNIENVKLVRALSDWMSFRQMTVGWIKLFRAHPSDVCVLNKGFYLMLNPWVDVAARLSSKRYVAVEHHPADPPDVAGFRGPPRPIDLSSGQFSFHHRREDKSVVAPNVPPPLRSSTEDRKLSPDMA